MLFIYVPRLIPGKLNQGFIQDFQSGGEDMLVVTSKQKPSSPQKNFEFEDP